MTDRDGRTRRTIWNKPYLRGFKKLYGCHGSHPLSGETLVDSEFDASRKYDLSGEKQKEYVESGRIIVS
jgi:hypothetical protein